MNTTRLFHDEAGFRNELAQMMNATRDTPKDLLEGYSRSMGMNVAAGQTRQEENIHDNMSQVLDMEIVKIVNEVHGWCASSLASSVYSFSE